MSTEDAKTYLSKREIPRLFEVRNIFQVSFQLTSASLQIFLYIFEIMINFIYLTEVYLCQKKQSDVTNLYKTKTCVKINLLHVYSLYIWSYDMRNLMSSHRFLFVSFVCCEVTFCIWLVNCCLYTILQSYKLYFNIHDPCTFIHIF